MRTACCCLIIECAVQLVDGTRVCLQEKMRALCKPMDPQPWEEDADDLVLFDH
jgi:hypothetical protein